MKDKLAFEIVFAHFIQVFECFVVYCKMIENDTFVASTVAIFWKQYLKFIKAYERAALASSYKRRGPHSQ